MEAELQQSAPLDTELRQHIHWLLQLRWVASSMVIYGTLVATGLLGFRLDPLPLYLIGAGIAGYNSLFVIALKWKVLSSACKLGASRCIANAQIVADLVSLTLLVHYSGGIENPLAFYFIFHVIIASMLLSRRETFVQATLANGLFASAVLGEFMGIIPHVHVFGPTRPDLAHDRTFVAATLLVFSSTLYLAAYMATSIVGRLRERGKEILELSGELERKAGELAKAYDSLAQLERLKSDQMHRVSQEIRAPLAIIQNSLNGMLDGLAGQLTSPQREIVAGAERRASRLLHLVTDLLLLSKARDVRLFTERKLTNPDEAVRRVMSAEAPRAASKGVALVTRIQEGIPPMFVDPAALEQLLANLVSNAVNYTPDGGRVELKVESVGDHVSIQVSDTGIGIPSAELPKIFNDFYRAQNARRFREEGTGLGLSIVRTIVEAHGGEIDVKSEVGLGTTFAVVLPRGTAAGKQAGTEHMDQPDQAKAVPPAPPQ